MTLELCGVDGCRLVWGHVGAHSTVSEDASLPSVTSEQSIPVSAREQIGRALDGALTEEQIRFLIEEVLAITKHPFALFTCKSCGQKQKQQCEVPDARAVTGALKDLMDQSWGRPSEVRLEAAELVVNRNVYVVGEAV